MRNHPDIRGSAATSILFCVMLLGVGAAGLWWAGGSDLTAALDEDRIVSVERRELLNAVTASGRVEPLTRVAVMSRASGIIKELLVEEGDRVQVGQVLAELDREQLQAALAEDVAEQASADARLQAAKARVDEARVRLQNPELDFVRREADRLELLFKTGDISERERDTAARERARLDFQIAQVQASLPVLEAAVAEARANQAASRAAVDRSRTALSEATVICPIDGIVLVRDKEVGDGVSSILTAGGNATRIMSLGDLSEMYVEARVDEVDLGRIQVGMRARVTVDAHRGRMLFGVVERIAPAGSVDGNGIVTFEVRVTIDDPDHLLRPDMTADAKLIIDSRADALVLPQSALQSSADGSWSALRVVGSGETAHTERVAVEIGLSDGLITEVVRGLAEGDRVLLPGP